MKNYLAIYMGRADAGEKPDAATIATGIKAWGQWMTDHADMVVTVGGPLGKTKKAGPGGVSDIRNLMTGYVIVRAESHDAAARLFEGHPHFSIFQGDGVEVMECLPIPGAP